MPRSQALSGMSACSGGVRSDAQLKAPTGGDVPMQSSEKFWANSELAVKSCNITTLIMGFKRILE